MMVNDITQQAGGRKRRKRVGRGESSGSGRTSGRGNKGAQSRAGYSGRVLSEGGQMPIFRRIPKRGFSNFNFRTEYDVVNVGDLGEVFKNGERVDAAALRERGLVRREGARIKILGDGELKAKLTFEVHAVSGKAREQIEKAGGSIQLIERRDSAALWKAKRKSAKNRAKVERPSRLEKKRAARSGTAK